MNISEKPEPPITVALVDTDEAFDGLEKTWNDLVNKSDCTIYQTFEWQRTWWKYFGAGKLLQCLVFKRDKEVVGIAPLYRAKVRMFGIPYATALRMLGSEEADYSDVLVAPADRPRVLKEFAAYLRTSGLKFDFFDIRDVSESFETMQLLPRYLTDSGLKVYTYKGSVCPQVALPPTWPEFLQHLGGNLRYQLRKKTDRMKKNFPMEFELAGDNDGAVEAAVRQFAVIHGNRWEGLGYINAFKDSHFLDFHIEVSQRFAHRGWLRMLFLKVNNAYVAVNFDFNFHKRIYFYHGNAHASGDIMKYSPGFLLRCAAIEQGIAEGMEVYDMLRGDEAYKSNDFKCTPVGNWQIRAVVPQGLRKARYRAFVVHEMLRKIPKRLRRERQDFRRFIRTKNPSASMLLKFTVDKFMDVARLVWNQIMTFRSTSK